MDQLGWPTDVAVSANPSTHKLRRSEGIHELPHGFVSPDKQWLHFAFVDNRQRAVHYSAKRPGLKQLDDCFPQCLRVILKDMTDLHNTTTEGLGMTITIVLPPDTERRLVERAERSGQNVETLARQLIERGVTTEQTLDEILAPFRRQVDESGMSDEDLAALFEEARTDAHLEGPRS
jgi:predicted transcriptional regulator